mmetsp:Transcript_19885/g.32757  ORF Transcript_19885/g.32757 Transcript_19885/m.32757 type:complete len:1043 (-) Transcript_19885:179-3307(-)
MNQVEGVLRKAVAVASGQLQEDDRTREQAARYCQQVQDSEKGWKICATILANFLKGGDKHDTAQLILFCLNAILQTIRKRYGSITNAEKRNLRNLVMAVVNEFSGPKTAAKYPPFLKNKIAVVIVGLLRHDYPVRWPNFFHGILKSIRNDDGVASSSSSSSSPPPSPFCGHRVDFFLRVLDAIDNDIVGFDENRSKEEVRHINQIKGHMQQTAMEPVVSALLQIASAPPNNNRALAKKALELLREFSAWISSSIVKKTGFLSSLFDLLRHPNLRSDVVDVLNELVRRRNTDVIDKIAFIQQARIFPFLQSIKKPDQEFSESIAALVDSVVTESIGGFRALESQSRAAELTGDSKRFTLTKGAANTAMQIMMKGMRFVVLYLEHPSFKVADELLGALNGYVSALSQFQNKSGKPPSEEQKEILLAILSKLPSKLAYPKEYDFKEIGEFEDSFDLFRENLEKLFVNMTRHFPKITPSFVLKKLKQVVDDASKIQPELYEAALRMFYRLYEPLSATDKMYMRKSGIIAEIMKRVVRSGVVRRSKHTLSVTYFELVSRYSMFLEKAPEFVKETMLSFLDQRGIGHPHPQVRSRASYLFFRVLRSFPVASAPQRQALTPLLPAILKALQQNVSPVLKRGFATGTQAETPLSVDSTMNLCETMGLICSSKFTNQGLEPFSGCCDAFRAQLVTLAKNRQAFTRDAELVGNRLAEIVNMIGSLTKYVTRDAMTFKRPLGDCLQAIVKVYELLPAHKELRSTTVFFLHRMLSCLKGVVVPHIHKTMELLVANVTAESLLQVSQLVNQIIVMARTESIPIVAHIFQPYVRQIYKVIASFNYIDEKTETSAYSTQIKERDSMRSIYFGFIRHVLLTPDFLPTSLYTPRNKACYEEIIKSVLEGISDRDLTVAKHCVSILSQVVEWGSKLVLDAKKTPGKKISPPLMHLWSLLTKDIGAATIHGLSKGNLDPTDAKANMIMLTIVRIHHKLRVAFGNDFLTYLNTIMCKQLGVTPVSIKEYLQGFNGSTASTSLQRQRNILRGMLKMHQQVQKR